MSLLRHLIEPYATIYGVSDSLQRLTNAIQRVMLIPELVQ